MGFWRIGKIVSSSQNGTQFLSQLPYSYPEMIIRILEDSVNYQKWLSITDFVNEALNGRKWIINRGTLRRNLNRMAKKNKIVKKGTFHAAVYSLPVLEVEQTDDKDNGTSGGVGVSPVSHFSHEVSDDVLRAYSHLMTDYDAFHGVVIVFPGIYHDLEFGISDWWFTCVPDKKNKGTRVTVGCTNNPIKFEGCLDHFIGSLETLCSLWGCSFPDLVLKSIELNRDHEGFKLDFAKRIEVKLLFGIIKRIYTKKDSVRCELIFGEKVWQYLAPGGVMSAKVFLEGIRVFRDSTDQRTLVHLYNQFLYKMSGKASAAVSEIKKIPEIVSRSIDDNYQNIELAVDSLDNKMSHLKNNLSQCEKNIKNNIEEGFEKSHSTLENSMNSINNFAGQVAESHKKIANSSEKTAEANENISLTLEELADQKEERDDKSISEVPSFTVDEFSHSNEGVSLGHKIAAISEKVDIIDQKLSMKDPHRDIRLLLQTGWLTVDDLHSILTHLSRSFVNKIVKGLDKLGVLEMDEIKQKRGRPKKYYKLKSKEN